MAGAAPNKIVGSDMTAAEIKVLRKKLGFTQQQMAAKLGVDRRTIIRWEAGEARPSQLANRQLKRLERNNKKQEERWQIVLPVSSITGGR